MWPFTRKKTPPSLPGHTGWLRRELQPSDCPQAGPREDLVRVTCGWCQKEQWHWTHSEGIGMAEKYGYYGAQSGDSICQNCGRGIYAYWLPWVRYEERADFSSRIYYVDGGRSGTSDGEDWIVARFWERPDEDDIEGTVYHPLSDEPHPCASGDHLPGRYWSGDSRIPGSLVRWRCVRPNCHTSLHWGRYEDGPNGEPYPAPSYAQQELWRAEMQLLEEEEERKRNEWIAQEEAGKCNARWEGGRCTRAPGHEGSHGQEIAPGIVVAPF